MVQTVDLRTGESGWGTATSDPVPDRDRISPPVLDPTDQAPVNPTSISVRLQAGFPLGKVKSHFHNVKIDSPDSSTRVITLADGAVPADRDFELTWTAAAEKTPSVGLFREQVAGSDYLLAYVTPPAVNDAEQKPLPREWSSSSTIPARWAAPRSPKPRPDCSKRSGDCSRTTGSTLSVSITRWTCCFRTWRSPTTSRKPRPSSPRCRRRAAPK